MGERHRDCEDSRLSVVLSIPFDLFRTETRACLSPFALTPLSYYACSLHFLSNNTIIYFYMRWRQKWAMLLSSPRSRAFAVSQT